MHTSYILGIESSCDETGAAVLTKDRDRIEILSNILASSASIQAKFGGIIPEQAAREQVKAIIPVVKEALIQAGITPAQLDAIAVTQGPGLIGSLLVGVETAKVFSWVWDKPIIPVNHLLGHFYANWIRETPKFPILGLLVSGGHTDLVMFTDHQKYEYLGGTRDDAAGECFDKCARLLGLSYPGGPQISNLARKGNPQSYSLPRPMIESDDFDFSFSGLKTAVSSLVSSSFGNTRQLPDFCAAIEAAILDSLINKVVKAIQMTQVGQLMVSGGVAANQKLSLMLKKALPKVKLYIPPPDLCTDNAAMIACRAFFDNPISDIFTFDANPNLSLNTT